ncbi:MAG: histidine--tRNA ligase [Bacilli bacterium]|jgi:histidyl-tRNA synthetase
MEIKPVKGAHDVIRDEASDYNRIEEALIRIAEVYAYEEFRTPVLEHTELFTRSVGDSSDIVRKEMYTFLDKGGRSLTLRPEVTASIIRTIVNNKLYANQDFPIKAYYLGPVFRYERPQAGRYRQFSQFGIEAVGLDSPLIDVEAIALGYNCLKALKLEDITLKINTLGDEESRNNYREALRRYFEGHITNMCPDCQERLKLNPLRILDCKVESDREIIKSAPRIHDYLSIASKDRFDKTVNLLDSLGIKFDIDESLVRGLDYYSEVVFEYHFISSSGQTLGALGGGGHYSELVSEIGGPSLVGVGLSFGVERLVQVVASEKSLPDYASFVTFYVMPVGNVELEKVYEINEKLRRFGYPTEMSYEIKPLKTLFKKAERRNALFAVLIGEDEIKNDTLTLKNLRTQEQTTVAMGDIERVVDQMIYEVLQAIDEEEK